MTDFPLKNNDHLYYFVFTKSSKKGYDNYFHSIIQDTKNQKHRQFAPNQVDGVADPTLEPTYFMELYHLSNTRLFYTD